MEYLRRDVNAFHREDYFQANIVREIRQVREMLSKNPRRIKLESFLLKFVPKKEKKGTVKSIVKAKEKANQMKNQFLVWAGIKKKED